MPEKVPHTPGPWSVETVKTQVGHCHQILPIKACLYVDHRDMRQRDARTLKAKADAALIAAAPDHAMLARAFAARILRWEPFKVLDGTGELCIDGLRYTTKLDAFGVPEMTPGVRAAIAKATAQEEK